MWLLYAFSGPVPWAASTHIDKYLVDRYFAHSDTAVLMVFTALIGALALPFIAWVQPDVRPQAWAIGIMVLSGVLYMGAMLFYLRAIQTTEASVIAPLFQTSTLFTVLLVWLLLHESQGWRQLAGVGLIFAGVAALGCGLMMSLSAVLFKLFALKKISGSRPSGISRARRCSVSPFSRCRITAGNSPPCSAGIPAR
jgi:uncharacterized membrane protein